MDAPNRAHVESIVNRVTADIRSKYERGQEEHGGNLWEKPGMIDHAIEEVLDLAVYLYTLRDQLRGVQVPPPQRYDDRALDGLYQLGRLWCPNCDIVQTGSWAVGEAPCCPHCAQTMLRTSGDERFARRDGSR